jgi:hypothetical protein
VIEYKSDYMHCQITLSIYTIIRVLLEKRNRQDTGDIYLTFIME